MPLIPLLPVCSIVINTGLIMTLEMLTWLRLVVWVAIGEQQHFRALPMKYRAAESSLIRAGIVVTGSSLGNLQLHVRAAVQE